MLDGQCPRVVETREPATETTLEDVLARNLSIRNTARTRHCGLSTAVASPLGQPPANSAATSLNVPVLLKALQGPAPSPRICPAALTAALRLVAMHAQLLLVRPLARARHVEGAQRLAGPRVQSAPPREKPLLLSTARST